MDSIILLINTKQYSQLEKYFLDIDIIHQFISTYGGNFLTRLCQNIRYEIYQPEYTLIEQGQVLNRMMFLMHGQVQYQQIQDGGSIGELLFLTKQPSKFQCITLTECLICYLEKEEFLRVIRKNNVTMSLINDLINFPIFQELSMKFLEQIIQKGNQHQYCRQQVVYDKGDTAQCFYIIRKGQFQMEYFHNNKFHPLIILEKGEYFGEIELYQQSEREYRITCLSSDNSVIEIPQAVYMALLKQNPQFESLIRRNSRLRKVKYSQIINSNIETLDIGLPVKPKTQKLSITSRFTIKKQNTEHQKSVSQLLQEKSESLQILLDTRWNKIHKEQQLTNKDRLEIHNPRLALYLKQLDQDRKQMLQHRKQQKSLPYLQTNREEQPHFFQTSPPSSARYMKILFNKQSQ